MIYLSIFFMVGFILATTYFIGMYYKTRYTGFLWVILLYIIIDVSIFKIILCLL